MRTSDAGEHALAAQRVIAHVRGELHLQVACLPRRNDGQQPPQAVLLRAPACRRGHLHAQQAASQQLPHEGRKACFPRSRMQLLYCAEDTGMQRLDAVSSDVFAAEPE